MTEGPDAAWLRRVRDLQAIAQEGLTYAQNPFDAARYTRLKRLTAEIAQALSQDDPAPLRLAVEQADGYLTPKLDVRAAVFDDAGRVLLVRERSDGRYSLPGGWADVGEGVAAGAVREVREESGYEVVFDRLLGLYDRERWGHPPMSWYTLKAVSACRLVGGDARVSDETDDVGWFARDALPELSAGRTSLPLLRRVRALQAIAQEGLTYTRDPFDAARFTRLKALTAEIAGALSEGEPAPLRLAVEQAEGYLTPKLDVRAAVFDDAGRVLLVRERRDQRWTLPGGWADVGEGIAVGAVREVREESGYVVGYDRLIGLYDRERWGHPPMSLYTLKAVVGCRLLGGEATTSIETDGVEWFGRDELPELSPGRTSSRLLQRVFEHHDDPTLPPDVD